MVLFRSRHSIYLSLYLRTIHRFVYYRVPPGSSPILANFSIRKLSGTITFDWKGLFSICKKPLEAKGLFFRFDTRVGAVSGGAGAWLGPKYNYFLLLFQLFQFGTLIVYFYLLLFSFSDLTIDTPG